MPRNQQQSQQKKPDQIRKVPPVATRQFVEAEEHVAQPRPRLQRSSGPARKALEQAHVEVPDGPVTKEKLAALAFMEEEVTVLVHDTTDETAEPLPQVINDGRSQFFIRGEEQKCKRKYVEVLARAKRTTYKQEMVIVAGEKTYRNVPHTALRFPFTVVEDHPKGRAWLKKILKEA
jgi:hypothetical protein